MSTIRKSRDISGRGSNSGSNPSSFGNGTTSLFRLHRFGFIVSRERPKVSGRVDRRACSSRFDRREIAFCRSGLMEIKDLIALAKPSGIGIADAFLQSCWSGKTKRQLRKHEVICDDTQCTLRILAQLLPPRDLTALPSPRSCNAGNRNAERNGSSGMHSRPQGRPALEQRGRESLRRNS